jgi:hypothetical protein
MPTGSSVLHTNLKAEWYRSQVNEVTLYSYNDTNYINYILLFFLHTFILQSSSPPAHHNYFTLVHFCPAYTYVSSPGINLSA